MSVPRYDVVIAGAGLPGLALARALAQLDLRVAILDRSVVDIPAIDESTWDARVYAVSPGSVAFQRNHLECPSEKFRTTPSLWRAMPRKLWKSRMGDFFM